VRHPRGLTDREEREWRRRQLAKVGIHTLPKRYPDRSVLQEDGRLNPYLEHAADPVTVAIATGRAAQALGPERAPTRGMNGLGAHPRLA
jgi:hypothetical protein